MPFHAGSRNDSPKAAEYVANNHSCKFWGVSWDFSTIIVKIIVYGYAQLLNKARSGLNRVKCLYVDCLHVHEIGNT